MRPALAVIPQDVAGYPAVAALEEREQARHAHPAVARQGQARCQQAISDGISAGWLPSGGWRTQ